MTYRVNAAVETMQPPRIDAPRHSTLAEPHLLKLPHRDNPMLPRSDLSQRSVGLVAFLSHSESKSTRS
jgi:hypothetical protein